MQDIVKGSINIDRPIRLLCCNIPTTACNLKCNYCYVDRKRFPNAPPTRMYEPELIARALTQERLGGKAYLQLCGYGETFMDPLIVEVSERLLRNGHYVALSTNGTVRKINDIFCAFPQELKERLHFFISIQWEELKRLNLLNQYAENVRNIKACDISMSVSVTLSDSLVPEIPSIKEYCLKEFGVLCHILECRDERRSDIPRMTELPIEEHQRLWGSFDSPTFEWQQVYWGQHRNEFCYMGESAMYLDFSSGNIWQACLGKKLCNIFDDLNEPIRFCALGRNCNVAHCYLGNILLGLGGVVPEIQYPSFASQRDRICPDGTTWFTPKVRDFFHQRVINNLPPYSESKKIYIDTVMAIVYGHKPRETVDKLRSLLSKALNKSGIKSCNIQGCTKPLGKWLYELLQGTEFDVRRLSERLLGADMTIITEYDDFPNIRNSLANKGVNNIVSILDIIV